MTAREELDKWRRGQSLFVTRRKPPALPPHGGCIAIFSPSAPALAQYPARAEVALRSLAQEMDCRVVVPPAANSKQGYAALSPEAAARELHRLALEPDIHVIMMAVGGYNSNRILSFLDWDLLAAHPKIYCGYSDASILLMAIQHMCGLVTLHGPALLPQWGEPGGPFAETVEAFRSVVHGERVPLRLRPPAGWTAERLDWAGSQSQLRRALRPSSGWQAWREGAAEGVLMGGNLATLNGLLGTPWEPRFQDAILLWEATGSEAFLPQLERSLTHLVQSNAFEGVTGMIVGRCPDAFPVEGVTLRDVVLTLTERYGFPIIADVDLGHTDPILTFPLGARASISAAALDCEITLVEKSVE